MVTTNDGMKLYSALKRRAWRPIEREPGDKWAERNIVCIPDSPIVGRLSFATTPWMREPIREGTTGGAHRVTLVLPVQIGKTLAFKVCAMYHIRNIPSPILFLSDTPDNAEDFALTSLNPMLRANPVFADIISTDRSKETKMTHVYKNGAILWTRGASTKGNLQRRSVRVVIMDECWEYPPGHMAEAVARTTRFRGWSKVIEGSQAGDVDGDIDKSFQGSDRREWMWTCPHCSALRAWDLNMVKWDTDARLPDESVDFAAVRDSLRYVCTLCGHEMPADKRTQIELNESSVYVAQNPNPEPGHIGFHTSAFCFLPAFDLVHEYITAKSRAKDGDFSSLRVFTQKRLALPWSLDMESFESSLKASTEIDFGEKLWPRMGWIAGKQLYEKRPEGITAHPLVFMAVDVQRGSFWYAVRAFSTSGDSMLLDCGELTSWEEIPAKAKEWSVPGPHVGIDSGDQTQAVYAFCIENNYHPMKGTRARSFRIAEKRGDKTVYFERAYNNGIFVPVQVSVRLKSGKVVTRMKKTKLISFSANAMKDGVHFARRRTARGKGPMMMHPEDTPAFYEEHVGRSEKRVQKNGEWVWEQVGKKANHLLDCETMLRTLAYRKKLPLDAG